jgi:hypothetical protein
MQSGKSGLALCLCSVTCDMCLAIAAAASSQPSKHIVYSYVCGDEAWRVVTCPSTVVDYIQMMVALQTDLLLHPLLWRDSHKHAIKRRDSWRAVSLSERAQVFACPDVTHGRTRRCRHVE